MITLEDAERNLRRVLAGKRPLAAVRPKVETVEYRYGDGALRQARELYERARANEEREASPMYTATERRVLETLAAAGDLDFPTLRRELAPVPGDCTRLALDNLIRAGEVRVAGPINAPRYTLGERS